MYFGRYIWNYIERIYARRSKRGDFFEYTSKFPTVRIPGMFLKNFEKMIKRSKIHSLKKNNFLTKSDLFNLKFKYIDIYLTKKKKYLVLKNFYYYIIYNSILKFTRRKMKFYYKEYDLFLSIHNGRYYFRRDIPKLNLKLSVFVETITYGSREAKKKKKEKNKKKPQTTQKKTQTTAKKTQTVKKKK